MTKFQFGVKSYDEDWFLRHGLGYQEAAQLLRDWGVTFVLAKSRCLSPPDSVVESEASPERAACCATYDDRRFRDALAEEGIAYWATVCTFYDPQAVDANPSLRPIGSDGRPMEQIDWYVGIAPSMDGYVAKKTALVEQAVEMLEPDGVFLSFTRWPGFWELWMPHHTRRDFPEYSFDPHTLDRFTRETGVDVPTRDPAGAARWIEAHARQAWTDWKCQVVADVVRQIREGCRRIKPDVRIMLNLLPFGADFDGAQAQVFGQRIEALADVVDVFEVMTYHQILKRPTNWLPQIGEAVKSRSGCETVCTLQAKPIYLDGIYARDHRSPTLDAEEFAEAVNAVAHSSVDGVVVFVWSDLLEEALKQGDTRRVDAIRAAAERR
ncbi:MAG TPA: hypothetical protein ENN19_10495 [Chloroflexi bacterium]|nr:hypothetical protein [Chloroflexota bacterium]